jgi:hypothetical protein
VYASTAVLQQARRLGVTGCLEVEVERAIMCGKKRKLGKARERLVDLGAFRAHVVKDGMTPQGRRRWRVTHIQRNGRKR